MDAFDDFALGFGCTCKECEEKRPARMTESKTDEERAHLVAEIYCDRPGHKDANNCGLELEVLKHLKAVREDEALKLRAK